MGAAMTCILALALAQDPAEDFRRDLEQRLEELDRKYREERARIKAEFERRLAGLKSETPGERLGRMIGDMEKRLAELEKRLGQAAPAPDRSEDQFIEAYLAYLEGDRDASTKIFKAIHEKRAREPIGAIAAYNVACNESLEGRSEEGVAWLKKALQAGYDNFDHLESDTDLESIREEVQAAVEEAKKKAPQEKRPPIRKEEAAEFARRLANAHGQEDGMLRQALFSRLGWFGHTGTVEWLNAELKSKGLKLEDSEGSWQIVEIGQ
jgi:hypothetical protein